MIIYDSHRWLTLVRVRGSVFPRAFLFSLPSTIAAGTLKWCERQDLVEMDLFDIVHGGSVYSGFTFVLGFVLVFRASQAYQRYWLAATSVHTMRAEWFDACSSLVAFAQISKHPQEHILSFAHTAIRLFCLLHAMALEEIADLVDENFPLVDIEGFSRHHLAVLGHEKSQGRKVEIVFQWIQIFIVQCHAIGILNVPPPILTRAYQYLGAGMINFHRAQQVTIWPFPFAYAQMNVVLINIYMFVTPLVMCQWTMHVGSCAVFTCLSLLCMLALDFIAVELENPFGMDYNDLPTWQMQQEMNRDLLMLVNTATWIVPQLTSKARSYEELVDNYQGLSLEQYRNAPPAKAKTAVNSKNEHGKKAERQVNWAKQKLHGDAMKVRMMLKLQEARDSVNSSSSGFSAAFGAFRGSSDSAYASHFAEDTAGHDEKPPTMAEVKELLAEFAGQIATQLGQHNDEHAARQASLLAEQGKLIEDHLRRQGETNERLLASWEQVVRKLSPAPLPATPGSRCSGLSLAPPESRLNR